MTDVAIVGIGCRFPGGVHGPAELWEFLLRRGDGIVEVPSDRWAVDRYYDPNPDMPGKSYTRKGGFLQDSLWQFDAEYFGVSPREASIMDPQQRLLLEVTQEALDDAGLAGAVAGKPVGVYVGGFTSDNLVIRHSPSSRAAINSHTATSGTFTMLSNRISFVYDLRGPSMTIDTACSSSLVALHEATQAISRGEIDLAVVGGVNVMLAPETFVAMCKGRFLAPDGHCKTFDAAADGYARGEGAGVLILKPLDLAVADNDRIYASIRATGSNQDGRTSGITVPNPKAQADLIRRVTEEAGIAPSQIGYVEAHGTGTAVGDPLELAALGATLGAVPDRDQDLIVGSIKNSIGHLEAAAGVASVIKAALTLHHRQIAPQAHLDTLNPTVPWEQHRIRIPLTSEPFPAGYELPAVSVNGFGYGGTNAHALLVAAPEAIRPVVRTAPAQVLPVSGRTEVSARAFAADLLRLAHDPAVDPAALADAVWSRRAHHQYRFAVPFADRDDLITRLAGVADGTLAGARTIAGAGSRPVYVFSGMGPQWWRMGRELLSTDGPFRELAVQIEEIFRGLAGYSLIEELLKDEADSRVTHTEIAQPANFLVQAGVSAVLASWGVQPGAIVGHSVGEVSAAYVSGMLSLRDAVTVSYHRSRLQATQAGTGAMMAVGLSREQALGLIGTRTDICVAAANSPDAVTLAGTHEAIDAVEAVLTSQGLFARRLMVEVPYHSHLMDPILDDLVEALAAISPREPTVPLYSTVTGQRVTGPDWGPHYWADNVRRPVLFSDAIEELIRRGGQVFCEIGPHPVLSGNIKEILLRAGETGATVPTLSRDGADHAALRASIAGLYVAGTLDTHRAPGASPGPAPHRTLPAQHFQRVQLWTIDPSVDADHFGSASARALPGDPIDAGAPQWQTDLSVSRLPWLRDHVVDGLVLLPGAAYLDAALAVALARTGQPAPALENVRFVAPLVVEEGEAPTLRCTLEESTGRFTVAARAGGATGWSRHATARIVDGVLRPSLHLPTVGETAREIEPEDLYRQLAERGLVYGPAFRRIRQARVAGDVLIARVDGTGAGEAESNHQAHPTVLDAALQCVALLAQDEAHSGATVVPAAVGQVRQFGPLTPDLLVGVTRLQPRDGESALVADVLIADDQGGVLVELHRVQFLQVAPRGSVAGELEPLWIEPIFEPRTAREAAGLSDLLAGERAFVIAAGEASMPWAFEFATQRGQHQMLTVRGGDPATICTDVTDALLPLLSDPEDRRPVVVAVVAATTGTDEVPPAHWPTRMAELPAAAVGVARAVQNIHDAALIDGTPTDLPEVHGVIITRGALSVPDEAELPDLGAASLVGVRRVLRNEQQALSWRLVDVDGGTDLATVLLETLVSGPFAGDDADEVALRDNLRLVVANQPSLPDRVAARERAVPLEDPDANFEIDLPSSRQLADVALREVPRRAPGLGEIELRVEGIGLSAKDAMKVLGVLGESELAGTQFGTGLGMEGLGVVTRVGPGVEGFAVGDVRILGVPGMAQRYLTTRVDAGPLDPADGLELEAFGSLVTLMTAHYALHHAARVRPGDWVLVAGGAGGVSMATVQLAAKAGARVIGTASTPQRAESLRSLGAEVVLDSRSLSALEQVREITGGHGADIVVSTAPGEAVLANLAAAAEFGRVVEVGKSEIYGHRMLDLASFDRNLTLIAIDLDRMNSQRRDLLLRVEREVLAELAAGTYELLPTRLVPVSQVVSALEEVARSTHLGRIVLDFRAPEPMVKPPRARAHIRPDATYLITGGLGGFGLETARWLADKGARSLVLAGRRGLSTVEQRAAVDALRGRGVAVRVEQVDVAQPASVRALLTALAEEPPLRGVFHTAGVLADEPLGQLSSYGLNSVLEPKARGALVLHNALAGRELDYFVLYSSVTSQSGTVPQLSYAAANATLDALAHYRRSLGLPATSVNWGAMAGGMAVADERVATYLALNGLRLIPMERGCAYLDLVLGLDVTQVGVVDIDWAAWGSMHPASAGTPRFVQQVSQARGAASAGGSVRTELAAMPSEQRVEVLLYMLAEQVAGVLGIPGDAVDRHTPLPDLGLDSLMAVELRARVNLTLDVEISAMEITGSGGLSSLASRLGEQLAVAR